MFGGLIVTLAMKNYLLFTFLLISLVGLASNNGLNIEAQLKIQKVELQIEQLKEQKSDLKKEIEIQNNGQQKQFNELKEELNYHRNGIDTWLAVLGILISFFGVVIPILGIFVGRKLYKDIKNQKEETERELQIFIEKETKAFNNFKESQQQKLTKLLIESKSRYNEITEIKSQAEKQFPIQSMKDADFQSIEQEELDNIKTIHSINQMFSSLRKNNYNETIKLGEKLLESKVSINDHYHIYFMLSNAFNSLKDYSKAKDYINKAIDIRDNDYKAWTNLGLILSKQNSQKDAIKAFQKARELNPRDPNPIANEALSYFELNEFKKSLTVIEDALKIQPDNVEFNLIKANSLFKLSLVNEAIDLLNSLGEKHPDDFRIYRQISSYYYHIKLYDKSIEALEKAIEKKPDDAELYALLGAAHSSNKNFKLAYDAFFKASDLQVLDKDVSFENLLNLAESTLLNNMYNEYGTIWKKIEAFDQHLKNNHLGFHYVKALSELLIDSRDYKDCLNDFIIKFKINEFSYLWNVSDTELFLSSEISKEIDIEKRIGISLFVAGVKSLLQKNDN